MNLVGIKNLVTSKVGRQLLTAQKHSPALLFGAGVVGIVGTVVLASRATLKVEEVLDEHNEMAKHIKTFEHVDYSDEDRTKDQLLLYIKTAGKFTKLYGPAVVVGVASIACLTSSHVILTKRNAGLMAAYAAVEKGFKEYRDRVVEDLGPDKDREYRYGAIDKEIVEETEEGQKITTMKKANPGVGSMYARFWDENSSSWNVDPAYNMMFLKCQQKYANDRLRAKGHVFLNEVYDDLGLPRTKEGQLVGWVWDGEGDNYIDFGIFNADMEPEHLAFFTGRENGIWLDFNVDGIVYDKI